MSTKINLESGDVYLKPQFYSKDEVIANELKTYNNYLLKWLRFDMGKNTMKSFNQQILKNGWLLAMMPLFLLIKIRCHLG